MLCKAFTASKYVDKFYPICRILVVSIGNFSLQIVYFFLQIKEPVRAFLFSIKYLTFSMTINFRYLFYLHFLSTGQVALTQSLSRISWILLLQCTFRASTQLGPHSSSFHRTATQDSPWGTYHTEISMPSASLYWSHKPMTISLFHITDTYHYLTLFIA